MGDVCDKSCGVAQQKVVHIWVGISCAKGIRPAYEKQVSYTWRMRDFLVHVYFLPEIFDLDCVYNFWYEFGIRHLLGNNSNKKDKC